MFPENCMLGSVSKGANYMKGKEFSGKEVGNRKTLKYVDVYLGNTK